MASESSQSSSSSPLPSPSSSSVPSPPPLGGNVGDTFIGSFISLISKYEIRYEGVLYHLNVQDSTLGLRNVRSYGTEGRKKDGAQVPPCDRVYDYILFRGSDIKDLQVNPSPSTQSRHEIQNDNSYSSGGGAQWVQAPTLSSKPVPTTQHSYVPLDFQPPSTKTGSLTGSSVSPIGSTQSDGGSSIPMPSFSQASRLPSTSVALGIMHQAVSSLTMNNKQEIIDVFSSPIMGLVDDTSQVVTRTPDIASNPSYSSHLGQAQRHAPPGLSSSLSSLSPLSESQFSASNSQNSYPVVSQPVVKAVYDSQSSHPNRSMPYESPAGTPYSAPMSRGPLSSSPQSFFGMEPLLQSRQPMMFGAPNPVSVDMQSRRLAANNYAPLLPPPVSTHQFRTPSSRIEFTEEFDFEAMNEKFKKSELWGFLGQNNQRNQNYYREETLIEPNAEEHTKPAYNKDDFFDTISCSSLDLMARSTQQQQQYHTQFPEAFGNHFQRPPQLQPGQGAYLAAQSNYRGGYNYNNNNYSNPGYGYYNGGRGRGRDTHF